MLDFVRKDTYRPSWDDDPPSSNDVPTARASSDARPSNEPRIVWFDLAHQAPGLPEHYPGLTYAGIAGIPGAEYFGCTRLRANINTATCASFWREANLGNSERRALCKCCPIGAHHAGVSDASLSPIRGATLCARCVRPATRLIQANICVSCYNREREFMKGRNARGKIPVKIGALCARQITYHSGSRVITIRAERSRSSAEMVVRVLRDSLHLARFAWRTQVPGIRQLRLF